MYWRVFLFSRQIVGKCSTSNVNLVQTTDLMKIFTIGWINLDVQRYPFSHPIDFCRPYHSLKVGSYVCVTFLS